MYSHVNEKLPLFKMQCFRKFKMNLDSHFLFSDQLQVRLEKLRVSTVWSTYLLFACNKARFSKIKAIYVYVTTKR